MGTRVCGSDRIAVNGKLLRGKDEKVVFAYYKPVGGEIVGYSEMLVEARQIATKRMVDEATAMGADAIVNIRFGSSAVMQGAAEVIAYGTAVKLI